MVGVAPLRGRGLKPKINKPLPTITSRSLTGAWIETGMPHACRKSLYRRSLTGAWIETVAANNCRRLLVVAPLRGRGLKHPSC